MEEADSKQANLQKTLEQAEKTTVAISGSLEKLEKAAVSVSTTTKDVTETAAAWQSTAKVIGDVAREYYKKAESQDRAKSFDANEWKTAAEQTSQAANDIKGLLHAIDDFSKARNYSGIINAITLRGMGFLVLIFVLAVIYRIISTCLMRAKDFNTEIKPTNQRTRKG